MLIRSNLVHKGNPTSDLPISGHAALPPELQPPCSCAETERQADRCDQYIFSLVYFCLIKHAFPLCLTGHAIFKLTYLSNHDYKPLYFESDAATVNEIVLKVSYG